MDSFNLDQNFIPNASYLQASEEAYSDASGACGSQPCMSGVSVQTLKSPLPNYVTQSDAVQNNAYSVNSLNQHAVAASTSLSNFISTYSFVDLPLDELDELDVSLGTKGTASDELIYTELNPPTDISTPLQGASCGKTSVNFSQSSPHPIAIAHPQQEAQAEAESDSPLLTVSQSNAVQNNAYSVNPLNQHAVAASTSLSNFISTYSFVDLPLDELDVYLGTDELDELDVSLGTKETASDELIYTELNPPTDISTPLQGASCGKTSVNFSQSSPHPIAIAHPQQEAQAEAESDSPLLTVSQSNAVQNNVYSVNPLNQHAVAASTSLSNFISTYNLVNFPLDELDVYLGTDELDVSLGTKETASDELIYTELNPPTDISTPLQGASCGKTSVNFSQSSPHPIAIAHPQQEAQAEAESDNPLLTVSQSNAVQNNVYSVNPLNQGVVAAPTSESNFISTDNSVNFPLGELDVYLGTKETASDELISTELNVPTDTSTPLQRASCGKTSVNFSQLSPRLVAIVNPQQKAQTEAESVNPLLTSSKGKAAKAKAQAKYDTSPARKAAKAKAQAKSDQSPARKAARVKAQVKYNQTPAGKAN